MLLSDERFTEINTKNNVSDRKQCPLILCANNYLHVVQNGNTALRNAVSYKKMDIINILLSDKRCDINAKNNVSDNILLHVTN